MLPDEMEETDVCLDTLYEHSHCAEPLPAAVVELVKAGSVSSIQDLQFLLFSESIEVETDGRHDNDTSNRLPRSLLDAQPAQQAICKVRTEVMEVTRSMLDRSNANFLLWPPCVEVQRCSGCCNTKSLQCVPVLTHTRFLQVMKIQYVNKHPLYDKAVISVLDHVECRCQPAPRPAQRRKPSVPKQDPRERTGKARPKDELHRRDELKHNQRLNLEDMLRVSESTDIFHGWRRNETQQEGVKAQNHRSVDVNRQRHVNETFSNFTERDETDILLRNATHFESQTSNHDVTNQTSVLNLGALINQTLKNKTERSQTANRTELASNITASTSQNQGKVFLEENIQKESKETSDVETNEERDRKSKETEELRHNLPEEEKRHLKVQQTNKQPGEKLEEVHHKQERTSTTTQQTGTTSSPVHHHKPPKPPLQAPKRRRKLRHRISKSAMRAMLM
ncbi:hypothetical protein DNTS_025212 [Danionella cerebrum]|uniref:Platelet-derived growth factor subunit B n=1 Tax=Danionella cerebrum TaxID=2873325 RepID=A0A553Q4C8_9TELE|nr:hypothetical protein DNTS_025212 [Danionella translucida]